MSSEVSGVLGYFTKLRLYKNDLVKGNRHLLTPKLLVRYAPGHMRDIDKMFTHPMLKKYKPARGWAIGNIQLNNGKAIL